MIDTTATTRPLRAVDTPAGRAALEASQDYSNRQALKAELARVATASVDSLDDAKVRELLESLGLPVRRQPAPMEAGPRHVAATIRHQIGLDAWLAVSARDFGFYLDVAGRTVVRFRIGSRHGLPVIVAVTYHEGRDTYSVECVKVRRNGASLRVLLHGEEILEDVYADSLGEIVRAFDAAAYF